MRKIKFEIKNNGILLNRPFLKKIKFISFKELKNCSYKILPNKIKIILEKKDGSITSINLKSNLEEVINYVDRISKFIREQELNKFISNKLSIQEIKSKVKEIKSKKHFDARLLLDLLFIQGYLWNISDLHFEPVNNSYKIKWRIYGKFIQIDDLSKQHYRRLVNTVKILSGIPVQIKNSIQEGSFRLEIGNNPLNFRVTVIPALADERVSIRYFVNQDKLLKLDELGFDDSIVFKLKNDLFQVKGLIIVSGQANSGKTTTLYACLLELIKRFKSNINIFTIEDPIEAQISGINQIQCNPQRGITFQNALKSILRQDPDVIMIGEIRDKITAHIAIESALTGHLVLATMHSGSPAQTITRLIDFDIVPYKISAVLSGILHQTLIPITCPNCKGKECQYCNFIGLLGIKAQGFYLHLNQNLKNLIKFNINKLQNTLNKYNLIVEKI